MENGKWKAIVDKIAEILPTETDRPLAQNVAQTVFKVAREFDFTLRLVEETHFEMIFRITGRAELKRLCAAFHANKIAPVNIGVAHSNPAKIEMSIILRRASAAPVTMAAAATAAAAGERAMIEPNDITEKVWLQSKADKDNFNKIIKFCINVDENQPRIDFKHREVDDTKYAIVGANLARLELGSLHALVRECPFIDEVELVCATATEPAATEFVIKYTHPKRAHVDGGAGDDGAESDVDRRKKVKTSHGVLSSIMSMFSQ
jgi:hypothetical protein